MLAAAAITLPFIFKAFHLDDTVFVWLGQEKLSDPFALGLPDHGYEGNFFSLYLDTHPPLHTSYLSLLIRIFGGPSEVGLHLGMIIFPALAAVSMFCLGKRFTDSPLTASLLLIVTPGFMVMAQSVMTDVPALSLWLAAVASYIYGIDRDDRQDRLLVLAGIFTSLAILTTYQSFSLLPLLFVYALLKRRVTFKTMLPLAAALAVFAAIVIYYLVATGEPPKLSYSFGVSLTPVFIANKILAIFSVLGGATVFPLFLAAGMLKGRKEYLAFAALFGLILIFFLNRTISGEYTLVAGVLQTVFYSAGLLAVYRFFNAGADAVFADKRSGKDRDNIFLVLWIAGVLVYSILLLPYASTRYLLPLFPPVVLLFVSYARNVFTDRTRWSRFAIAAVACTAIMGTAVSIADYQLSGVYRDFAGEYPGKLTAGDHQIWFAGEFGLRYYLEAEGGRYLTKQDDSPAPGDHVILSHGLIAYFISDELKNRLQLVESIEYPAGAGWPIRIQDRNSQAGFYDQFHGNLPFSISSEPVETIDIYRVKDLADIRSQE
ncbi:MAG: glycosyltransferase family 39 protein [Thermoleophilia bacterium]